MLWACVRLLESRRIRTYHAIYPMPKTCKSDAEHGANEDLCRVMVPEVDPASKKSQCIQRLLWQCEQIYRETPTVGASDTKNKHPRNFSQEGIEALYNDMNPYVQKKNVNCAWLLGIPSPSNSLSHRLELANFRQIFNLVSSLHDTRSGLSDQFLKHEIDQ